MEYRDGLVLCGSRGRVGASAIPYDRLVTQLVLLLFLCPRDELFGPVPHHITSRGPKRLQGTTLVLSPSCGSKQSNAPLPSQLQYSVHQLLPTQTSSLLITQLDMVLPQDMAQLHHGSLPDLASGKAHIHASAWCHTLGRLVPCRQRSKWSTGRKQLVVEEASLAQRHTYAGGQTLAFGPMQDRGALSCPTIAGLLVKPKVGFVKEEQMLGSKEWVTSLRTAKGGPAVRVLCLGRSESSARHK
jgi:hypothetical protein